MMTYVAKSWGYLWGPLFKTGKKEVEIKPLKITGSIVIPPTAILEKMPILLLIYFI